MEENKVENVKNVSETEEKKKADAIIGAMVLCTMFLTLLILCQTVYLSFQDKQELRDSLVMVEQLKTENRQLRDTIGYRDAQISSMFDERVKLKERIQALEGK